MLVVGGDWDFFKFQGCFFGVGEVGIGFQEVFFISKFC